MASVDQSSRSHSGFLTKDEKGEKGDLYLKIVLLGDAACGKTALARRWSDNEVQFDTRYSPTQGLDVYEHRLTLGNQGSVVFQMWDVSISARTGHLARLAVLLKDADCIGFCYDVEHVGSFMHLEEWLKVVQESCVPPLLRTHGKLPLHLTNPNATAPSTGTTTTSTNKAGPGSISKRSLFSLSSGFRSVGGGKYGKPKGDPVCIGMRIEEHLPFLLLIGCKLDNAHHHPADRPVRIERHRAMVEKYSLTGYLTSAKTGEGVQRLAVDIVKELTGLSDETFPRKKYSM